ncbi:MAG: DnaJ domain-containing protein [Alphaproteobacteria bacterium]|nr:DnaJ domain-containing protein [Alphaproteobacteria bacterium]
MLQVLIVLGLAFGALSVVRLLAAERAFVARHFTAIVATGLGALLALRGGVVGAVLGPLLAGGMWAASLYGAPVRRAARAASAGMSAREAREILGVDPDASAEEIRSAFRAKMRAAHPDQGGTSDSAARLVAARDVLLRSRPGGSG